MTKTIVSSLPHQTILVGSRRLWRLSRRNVSR